MSFREIQTIRRRLLFVLLPMFAADFTRFTDGSVSQCFRQKHMRPIALFGALQARGGRRDDLMLWTHFHTVCIIKGANCKRAFSKFSCC